MATQRCMPDAFPLLVPPLHVQVTSLFVVGDLDQAIYSWRGAQVRNMTEAFRKDYRAAQVRPLRRRRQA